MPRTALVRGDFFESYERKAMKNVKDLQNAALRILQRLNPKDMTYGQWFGVGAALKGCGCEPEVWDDWSGLDPRRYHAGECERKWAGMRGTGIGALYALMRDMGVIDTGSELDWDDELLVGGVETLRLAKPHGESFLHLTGESKDETIAQLVALFEEGELVCYVNRLTIRANGKYEPKDGGHYDRTCAQLIRDLEASSDIGGALGD